MCHAQGGPQNIVLNSGMHKNDVLDYCGFSEFKE